MTSSYQERVSGGSITKGVDRWSFWMARKNQAQGRKALHCITSDHNASSRRKATSPSAGRHASRTRSKFLLRFLRLPNGDGKVVRVTTNYLEEDLGNEQPIEDGKNDGDMGDEETEPEEKEEGDQTGEEEEGESVIGVSLVQEELPDLGSNEMEVEQSLVSEAANLQPNATQNNAIPAAMETTGTIICQQSDDSHLTEVPDPSLFNAEHLPQINKKQAINQHQYNMNNINKS